MPLRINDTAPDFIAETTQGHAVTYPMTGDPTVGGAKPFEGKSAIHWWKG
jgi:hypothetical protein